MKFLGDIRGEIDEFETATANFNRRKELANGIETLVLAGSLTLQPQELLTCRYGRNLERILVYLMFRYDKLPTVVLNSVEELKINVERELRPLQANNFASGSSLMPLEYSLAAYLAWLERNRGSVGSAVDHDEFFKQIEKRIEASDLDIGKQTREKIQEIRSVISTANKTSRWTQSALVKQASIAADAARFSAETTAEASRFSAKTNAAMGKFSATTTLIGGLCVGLITGACAVLAADINSRNKPPAPCPAVSVPANPPTVSK